MARLPRIEFRETIFEDDEDRLIFLRTLAEVVERFHWLELYPQMEKGKAFQVLKTVFQKPIRE